MSGVSGIVVADGAKRGRNDVGITTTGYVHLRGGNSYTHSSAEGCCSLRSDLGKPQRIWRAGADTLIPSNHALIHPDSASSRLCYVSHARHSAEHSCAHRTHI